MGVSNHFPETFREKPTVRAEALAIVRGSRTLFDGLSFAASPGDFLEIRGPNGAGKTSLLRALAGFLRPAAGRVMFDGAEEPALALHALGHRDGLKGQIDARAHLRFWVDLLGGSRERVESALGALGLSRIADLPARALSQGQARRLALGRLLVAPRPVWLLDEPAAGLDASGKALLAEMIEAHRGGGGLVLAALHETLGATPTSIVELA